MSLHATICRYDGVTGSTEDVTVAGRRLASALSAAPGFVSYALLDAGDGMIVSVNVFEDRAGLEAGHRFMVQWVAEHLTALLPRPPQIIAGEVIVQRGM